MNVEEKIERLADLGYNVTIVKSREFISVQTSIYCGNTYYENNQDAKTLDAALNLIAERNASPIEIKYEIQ